MYLFKVLSIALCALILSSCNIEKLEAEQAAEFDQLVKSFKLSSAEIETAKHALVGYKKDMGTTVLPSREIRQAICYATSVEMPLKLQEAHALYLQNYTEIDKDYINWFSQKGIDEDRAIDMGRIYKTAHDACKTTQGRLRNMKALKAR